MLGPAADDEATHGRTTTWTGPYAAPAGLPRSDGRRGPLAFEARDEDEWHRLARGYRLAGLLLSAHRLGLLAALARRAPRSIDDLADALVADPNLLLAICRALRAAGVLEAVGDDWTLSDAGERLAADTGALLELDFMAEDYQRWGELDRHARDLRRLGRAEPRTYDGTNVAHNERAARRYARRMSHRRRRQVRRLLDRLEPTRSLTILDAWGGDGYVARRVTERWTDCSCTVLEIPTVAVIAREECAAHPRIAVVTEDLLTGDPAEALGDTRVDLVILSHVLQSLSETRRRELATQIFHVLAPGGCVLSNEYVLRWNDTDSLDVLLWAVGRTSANWHGDVLSATEQDLLLRGTGLAAVAAWWVTDATRAVLGVKTAAGVTPAVRLLPGADRGRSG